VTLIVWLRADAAVGKPGDIIRLHADGEPMYGDDGQLLKVKEDPNEPGDYRVNLEDGYFLVHLPTGYTQDESLACVTSMHGAHETETTKFAIDGFRLNKLADKGKFIAVYPIAQTAYTILGEPHHTWNSPIGTVSDYWSNLRDDAKYLERVYGWVTTHLRVDKKRFSLGGFSDGAILSNSIAQTSDIPIDCLFLAGGTMFDRYLVRHRKDGKGPNTVVIQVSKDDDEILPLDTAEGEVQYGKQYWQARNLVGLRFDLSKPRRQVDYWLGELLARAGGKQPIMSINASDTSLCTSYTVLTPGGEVLRVVIYSVPGGHALHGQPAAEIQGIQPNPDFPWPDKVAGFVTGDIPPEAR